MKATARRLLTATATIFLASCHSGGGQTSRAIASPDRAYVAVQITDVGSEMPSSSCIDTIVVVPSKDLSSGRYPASSRAYVGGCHSLKMTLINGQPTMPNGPQLRWSGPRELSIVFDPKGARSGGSTFYSVTSLYDGAITIRNEPQ